MWLQYGTPQSLLLLLFKRISGTRHVGIDDIPQLMDEYDFYEDIYFGKIKEPNDSKRIKINGIYEYINHLDPPKAYPALHIPYRILIQQAGLFKNQTIESNIVNQILDRLKKYGLVKNQEDYSNETLQKKIVLAIRWANELSDMEQNENGASGLVDERNGSLTLLSLQQKDLLKKIKVELENLHQKTLESHAKTGRGEPNTADNDELAQEVQSIIFNSAKNNQLQPKEVFRLFYQILINSERGPRLGSYIADLGLQNVIVTLEKRISS